MVTYVGRGGAVEGADIRVADVSGNLTRTSTGRDGTATMYLPPGSYSVVAADGNDSSRQTVVLAAGESLQVTFGSPATSAQIQEAVLGLSAAAGVGIMLNIFILVRKRRNRLKMLAEGAVPPRA